MQRSSTRTGQATPPVPPQPGPSSGARKGSSSGPPPRSSRPRKKIACPAGKNCTCGNGWECDTCGSCLDGGCVPPCPEALDKMEFQRELREKKIAQGSSTGPIALGTGLPKPSSSAESRQRLSQGNKTPPTPMNLKQQPEVGIKQ